MKKICFVFLIAQIVLIYTCPQALAFWVWSPKTGKFFNPKFATKDTPEEQFKWAMKFFKDKSYKRAAEEFIRLTNSFKDSDIAPEAQYYAGLSYEESGKYYLAFQHYQKTIDNYPFTRRIDEIIERQFTLGNKFYAKNRGRLMGMELMTDLERAKEIFKKVRENSPFGEYADQAQFMVGRCHKKAQEYNEAAEAFQKLVDEYPNSGILGKAKYELAQCTYLASLMADYDQELTDGAIEEYKAFVRKAKDPSLVEEADEIIALLKEKKAESIFNSAKFYEKQKKYQSASIYYKEILEKYPDTSSGKLADENLKKIEKLLRKKR